MIKNKYNKWILVSATVLTLTACGSSGGGTTDGGSDGGTNEPAKPTQNSIIHNGTLYGTVVSPFTGRVWLDRNLGAERVCTAYNDTACYGDLYQWGRDYDGHQDRHSDTTKEAVTDLDDAGHRFAVGSAWFTGKAGNDIARDELNRRRALLSAKWKRTDGSSVCPIGFYVPDLTELKEEFKYIRVAYVEQAFTDHFFKIPAAGIRIIDEIRDVAGEIRNNDSRFAFWSNKDKATEFAYVDGHMIEARIESNRGLSIRCIKKK